MHKLIDKPDQFCLLIALSVVLVSLVSFSDAEAHYHEFVVGPPRTSYFLFSVSLQKD